MFDAFQNKLIEIISELNLELIEIAMPPILHCLKNRVTL